MAAGPLFHTLSCDNAVSCVALHYTVAHYFTFFKVQILSIGSIIGTAQSQSLNMVFILPCLKINIQSVLHKMMMAYLKQKF